ncbi:D-3-phosphoglycerate dehydrogenase 1, chloroplastic [Gracilariopsis chorda]|uniref:D-3-phosphoglycerate dehydrogenase n=1 Tax=Gracilariopsis chorda TaxID=448386 RepID=A0A2V3IXG5_9FLOR|nr:D-3-phosphoglycerate dehydrogenase 1, chloroplastic [Gracilariopsis chorda]|eukprot:PXF46832.1 D-3-phosphoglycerate dehydrogenase 1, chloroplastic [Gracilariopsis chorda]
MVAVPERVPTSSPPIPGAMSVLLPEKLSDEGISLLSARFNVVKKLDLTPEQLLSEIPHYDAIIIRSGTKMTRQLIEAAPRLKVIGRAGVGVDNIDISTATERGVLVVNAPTGNCVAAAEHTIALLCAATRHISPADKTIKNGGWDRSKYVGVSLVDKTLGVVGLGRIGREVAKRARGLGMHVIASDPFTSEEAAAAIGVTLAPFEQVLAKSDFLTLHIPLIPSTKDMINADAIAKMKHGARIINAARGGVVNETALLEALDSGKIAGAALDCFEFEPPFKYPDSVSAKLVQHPAVLATPHLGASTREAQLDVAVEIATAVRDSLDGDMVATMVNAPNISPESLKSLKPRAALCEALGRLAYYVSGRMLHGEAIVDYFFPDASDDTRLLRAGLIKGLMEPALGVKVTIVNADNIAKNHNLSITETNHYSSVNMDSEVVVTVRNTPPIEGRVTSGNPHVTRIGRFEVDLRLDGIIMAYSQDDRPGQMGLVGTLLGDAGVNISSMTLARDANSSKALVILGLDSRPSEELVKKVENLINDSELRPIVMEF